MAGEKDASASLLKVLSAPTIQFQNKQKIMHEWIWYDKVYVVAQVECVPVVWGQVLRPAELYCTSVQAFHWAEKPWEQSHAAESSLTSQRWHTLPTGHKNVYTLKCAQYKHITGYYENNWLTQHTSTTCESLSHLLSTVWIRAKTCCKTTTT